jgi:hypothetical protein
VNGTGDVDGDGVDDLIIGTNVGESYVVFGRDETVPTDGNPQPPPPPSPETVATAVSGGTGDGSLLALLALLSQAAQRATPAGMSVA